jgi:uncharacterized protein (TIGR02001 family)
MRAASAQLSVGMGVTMRAILLSTAMVLSIVTVPAMAADMPVKAKPAAPAAAESAWDIAFGSALMSDYNARGISQSGRHPSVLAYFEPRYNVTKDLQLYIGVSGESIDFPNHAPAEIDLYGGIRPTFGSLALDFGFWYYAYPGGTTFAGIAPFPTTCTNGFFTITPFSLGNPVCNVLKGDLNYWEFYGKGTYTVNDNVSFGANVFYDPSWWNEGAPGLYASGTFKLTAPSSMLPSGLGIYVSGELGHYWFGTTDAFYGTPLFPNGIQLPGYTTWNVGLGFTYKVFTLDLRYYDTDVSKGNCNVLMSDHTATFNPANASAINPDGLGSNWCGAAFIAKLSADLTLASLK